MRTLYFDCFSGIGGDRALAALLDLGVPLKEVTRGLRMLPVRGYELRAEKTTRAGITGTKVTVSVRKGSQKERKFSLIACMIRESSLPPRVKDMGLKIFQELARVESRIHGVPIGKVEFHEIGGVDSIVDIVGTCLGLESLGVQTIRSSPLPWGRGWVESHGGIFPLPAPATAELLKGIPVVPLRDGYTSQGPEYVTPTGIAILKGVAQGFGDIPSMTLENVGYGAGAGNYEFPNLLRVVIGKAEQEENGVIILETNIDDMNPQLFEPLMERLFHEGALDVFLTPVQMKKGRPGVLVTAIAREEDRDRLARAIFSESTTIGLRWFRVNRYVLGRERVTVKLKGESIRGKATQGPWGRMFTPEYDDMRRLAHRTGKSVKDIYFEAVSSYKYSVGRKK